MKATIDEQVEMRIARPIKQLVQNRKKAMSSYLKDCRLFTGYKPCRYKRSCQDCPHYDPVKSRIAILSLEAMGAVLRSTCLLEPIKRKFPNSHISWFTLKASRPLPK